MAYPGSLLKLSRLTQGVSRTLAANIGARVGALVALSLATLLIARVGGPAAVGIYALLRVIPSLIGVVASAGLPGAVTYFLAGPSRDDRRLPLTICVLTIAGGALGMAVWFLGTPVIGHALLPGLSTQLILLAGVTVLTQLIVATGKSCSQGTHDLRGANIVIVNEELMFLPAYGLLWAVGSRGNTAIVVGLLLADIATFVPGWIRLARRGFFHEAASPSLPLARDVSSYGLRAQVGGVMTLLNLRLDFMILSLMAGPAVLGIYAIASKYAEFLKIPGVALTYVLYPAYSRLAPAASAAKARVQMRSAGFLVAGAAVPLWLLAGPLIPAIYGSDFHSAVVPARIIVLGLVLEGVAGVITAFLYGIGRPGQNSWAMGAGLAVTVVLDVTLIPHFGATGAAVASAVAYVSSTLALIWLFRRAGHRIRAAEAGGDISPRVAELHTQIEQVRAGISKLNELSEVRPGP